MSEESKCPVIHGSNTKTAGSHSNVNWWPQQLNLNILHQHDKKTNPMEEGFLLLIMKLSNGKNSMLLLLEKEWQAS